MKTAISLPDETFRRVDERAAALGMSRSEFFWRAAERYLDELDGESLTAQINEAIDRTGQEPLPAGIRERMWELVKDDEW
jgi:metal-responsive CopG/Arc/MetJ family transcriptional regulator